MDPAKTLLVFDIHNMINGIGIFIPNRNRFLLIINYLRALSIIAMTIFISLDSYLKKLSHKTKARRFWTFIMLASNSSVIIYFIVIYLIRKKICFFIQTQFRYIEKKQALKIKRISIVLSLFLIVFTIIMKWRLFYTYFVHYKFESEWFLFFFLRVIVDFKVNVFKHGLILITLLISISFYCHQKLLLRLFSQLNRDKKVNVHLFLKTILFIEKNMKFVNSIIGPIILIISIALYVYPVCLMYIIFHFTKGDILSIIHYVIFVIGYIVVIILSQKLTSSLNSIRSEILDLILLDVNGFEQTNAHLSFIINALKKENLFTLTAMDVFNLDYNMLICFLGSLIQICVLFCQLIIT